MGESGESSSEIIPIINKPLIVRVKRKLDQSPLEALWLEINDRPVKRPLIDFHKLSISNSKPPLPEELKSRRVLVQHVETLDSSQETFDFLTSFVQPNSDCDTKSKASGKERRFSLQKEKKLDRLLSKAKQDQEELAKNARFEQLWKRRRENREASDDLDEVCRVYDVVRVDVEETDTTVKQHDEMSVEDQEILSKFLPLLRECIPNAAEEIESDINSHAPSRADEYVYDLYAVKEIVDEKEASCPFPLVQVDVDDEYYDGPDYSDYETDDSNDENHRLNDYPEEESTDDEKKSKGSGSETGEEEEGSETKSDTLTKSEDFDGLGRSKDFEDDDMDENCDDDSNHADYDDDAGDENWRWSYR